VEKILEFCFCFVFKPAMSTAAMLTGNFHPLFELSYSHYLRMYLVCRRGQFFRCELVVSKRVLFSSRKFGKTAYCSDTVRTRTIRIFRAKSNLTSSVSVFTISLLVGYFVCVWKNRVLQRNRSMRSDFEET